MQRWGVVLGIWLLWMSAEAVAATQPVTMPLRLYRGYSVVVEGRIGRLKGLHFLIDTGAVPSVVDQSIARKLGLKGGAEPLSVFSQEVQAQRVVLPELQLGPIQLESLSVLSNDLSFIEEGLGVRIDALVGLDVLGQSSFSIDYKKKKMIFGPIERGATFAALENGQGFVVISLEIQGKPFRLLLDTGAKHLVLFEQKVRGRLALAGNLRARATSNIGVTTQLRQVKLSEVRLGNSPMATREAYLLMTANRPAVGFDGLLGVASLDASRIGFDFEHRTFAWER